MEKSFGGQEDGVGVGFQGHGEGAGDAACFGQFGGFADVFFFVLVFEVRRGGGKGMGRE